MASLDEKISELNSLTVAASADLIPLVDVDQVETKNIRKDRLFSTPGPIGNWTPSTGEFTELTVVLTVNEIFDEDDMISDSDTGLATQQSIKTYVDNSTGGATHNSLSGLQGGDSTSDEFYHLTQSIHDGLYSASPIIGLGAVGGMHVEVDNTAGPQTVKIGDGTSTTEFKYSGTTMQIYNADGPTIQLKGEAAGEKLLFSGAANGSANTYYAGVLTVQTQPDGMVVYSSTGDLTRIGGENTESFFRSITTSNSVKIQGTNSAVAVTDILVGDPDGAAELYHAGTKVFETQAAGVSIADGTAAGCDMFYASDVFFIRNLEPGGNLTLQARRDDNGANQTVFSGNPDGDSSMYRDGSIGITTTTRGMQVNWADTPSRNSTLAYDAADEVLYFTNNATSGEVIIRAKNSVDANTVMADFDPDGAASLYHAGVQALATNVRGIEFGDGTDLITMHYYTGTLQIKNSNHGGGIEIAGEKTAGTHTVLFSADPDAQTQLYYAGSSALSTQSLGVTVKNSSTYQTVKVQCGSGWAQLAADENGATIELKSKDSGGVWVELVHGDPDGAVELYNAGVKTFSTLITGSLAGISIYDINEVQRGQIYTTTGGLVTYRTTTNGGDWELRQQPTAGGQVQMIFSDPDAGVSLSYAGVKVFETTANGITIPDLGGGTGLDLRTDQTGHVEINATSNSDYIQIGGLSSGAAARTMARFYPDAGVHLYNDGSERFRTYSGGGYFTGTAGLYYVNLSTAGRLQLLTSGQGVQTEIQGTPTGGGTNMMVICDPDGPVDLYYAGTKILNTATKGITVGDGTDTFDMQYITTTGNFVFDNQNHGGAVIFRGENNAGDQKDLAQFDPDGAAELYYAGTKVFETDSTGVIVTGDIYCDDLYASGDTIHIGNDQIKSTDAELQFVSSTTSDRILKFREGGGGWSLVNDLNAKGIDIVVKNADVEYTAIAIEGGTQGRTQLKRSNQNSVTSIIGGLAFGNLGGGSEIYNSGTNLVLDNSNHAGKIVLQAEDTGGTTRVMIDTDPDGAAELYYAGTKVFETDSTGVIVTGYIQLESGASVNEILTDGTLAGGSATALVTESAVKTYVDTQVSGGVITGQEALVNGDSTATIVFVSSESDTNYSIAYSLVNTIDITPSIYASIVTEKTVDGFIVTFSGTLDSANYILDWLITR